MVELHSCNASIKLITWRHTISTICNKKHQNQFHPPYHRNRARSCGHTEPRPVPKRSVCLSAQWPRGPQAWRLFSAKASTRNWVFKTPEASQSSSLHPSRGCQGIRVLISLICSVIHTRGSMAFASFMSNHRTPGFSPSPSAPPPPLPLPSSLQCWHPRDCFPCCFCLCAFVRYGKGSHAYDSSKIQERWCPLWKIPKAGLETLQGVLPDWLFGLEEIFRIKLIQIHLWHGSKIHCDIWISKGLWRRGSKGIKKKQMTTEGNFESLF